MRNTHSPGLSFPHPPDFEQESGLETAMRFIPDMALAAPTAPAMLPTTVIQPVDTPFEELLSEHPGPEPVTSPPLVTEVTEVVEEPFISLWALVETDHLTMGHQVNTQPELSS